MHQIFFQDGDGQATANSVEATLLEVEVNLSEVSLGSVISDDMFANDTTDQRFSSILDAWPDDLSDAQHYVRVVMTADGEAENPLRFTRIRLFHEVPESP